MQVFRVRHVKTRSKENDGVGIFLDSIELVEAVNWQANKRKWLSENPLLQK